MLQNVLIFYLMLHKKFKVTEQSERLSVTVLNTGKFIETTFVFRL